jgi:hypothetical protein
MNVLKAAIVGIALISGNALVRADVITDWNSTAMDVMKAVNVAGNPWTRSMALVNVSMSDAVNSVQNRYSRYIPELPADPNASAEAATAAAARKILSANIRPEGTDRYRLRRGGEIPSGQSRAGPRVSS